MEPLPSSAGPTVHWLPHTRLVRPAVSREVVLDEHLLTATRDAVRTTPVTLISAQAGAGKTTLAAAVAETGALPVAWASLDSADDDLDSLLVLLAGALEPVVAGGCPALIDLMGTGLPAARHPRRAVGVLLNDVLAAAPPRFVLVLDDAHHLRSSAALAALDYLAERAPPAFRLLLTARIDPPIGLARLRSQGRLTEVRSADLLVDAAQAERLLNGQLHLSLTAGQVGAVVEAAAGWVTGVRLLGRSLNEGRSATAADPQLAGDPTAMYDYLTDEVLTAQDEGTREFLLDTCVLTDLTPAACGALTGRPDAGRVLEELRRQLPLLVLGVDAEAEHYRYHDLFAGFLRRRLSSHDAGRAADLHLRAAAVVQEPPARVAHLLAAGRPDAAAELIEQIGRTVLFRAAHLQALAALIARLDLEPAARPPWLALLEGVAAVARGELVLGIDRLEQALSTLSDGDDVLGRWAALRWLHLATTDHARFVPQMAALERDPEFARLPAASQADHQISSAYGSLYTGRWSEAGRRVGAAIDVTMTTGDSGAIEVLAQHLSPLTAAADGVLTRMEAYASWVEHRSTETSPLAALGLHTQRAIALFLRGRPGAALAAALDGLALLERLGGAPFLRASLEWVAAGTWQLRGDHAAAARLLSESRGESTDLDRALDVLRRALWARILHAQGRGVELTQLAGADPENVGGAVPPRTAAVATLSVQAQAAAMHGDLRAAVASLRAATEIEDDLRLVPFVVSPRLDLALVLVSGGDVEAALRELTPLLGRADAWGMPGLLVHGGRPAVPLLELAVCRGMHRAVASAALMALGDRPVPDAAAVPGTPEVLTSREIQVLRLVAAGASNADIAETLVVSIHTAKTHVRHVMTKLTARSRTEAVALARGHGLL
jgi:LuxR family maltose regulon positive regulatory protein